MASNNNYMILYFNKHQKKLSIEKYNKIKLFGWIEVAKGSEKKLNDFKKKVEKLSPFLILKNADIKLLWSFYSI